MDVNVRTKNELIMTQYSTVYIPRMKESSQAGFFREMTINKQTQHITGTVVQYFPNNNDKIVRNKKPAKNTRHENA